MPHLTLEYTSNLDRVDFERLLAELNLALVASNEFQEDHIKSRAVVLPIFKVGTSPEARGFVHAKLALLSGRSAAVKKQLSESLCRVLEQAGTWPRELHVQLCVEIVDIDRASYSKLSLPP